MLRSEEAATCGSEQTSQSRHRAPFEDLFSSRALSTHRVHAPDVEVRRDSLSRRAMECASVQWNSASQPIACSVLHLCKIRSALSFGHYTVCPS